MSFCRIRGAEEQPRASAGMGVRVRLHPCHEGACTRALLRKSFRKQPSFMLTQGELGGTNNKKGQVRAKAFRLTCCSSVCLSLPSPLQLLLTGTVTFLWVFSHQDCLSCDLAMAVGFQALSIPKKREDSEQQDVDGKNETRCV